MYYIFLMSFGKVCESPKLEENKTRPIAISLAHATLKATWRKTRPIAISRVLSGKTYQYTDNTFIQ